jgi:hypothetical protein
MQQNPYTGCSDAVSSQLNLPLITAVNGQILKEENGSIPVSFWIYIAGIEM